MPFARPRFLRCEHLHRHGVHATSCAAANTLWTRPAARTDAVIATDPPSPARAGSTPCPPPRRARRPSRRSARSSSDPSGPSSGLAAQGSQGHVSTRRARRCPAPAWPAELQRHGEQSPRNTLASRDRQTTSREREVWPASTSHHKRFSKPARLRGSRLHGASGLLANGGKLFSSQRYPAHYPAPHLSEHSTMEKII